MANTNSYETKQRNDLRKNAMSVLARLSKLINALAPVNQLPPEILHGPEVSGGSQLEGAGHGFWCLFLLAEHLPHHTFPLDGAQWEGDRKDSGLRSAVERVTNPTRSGEFSRPPSPEVPCAAFLEVGCGNFT